MNYPFPCSVDSRIFQSDFPHSAQHYPQIQGRPLWWLDLDKQITKLVYPGIVFPRLFLQPKWQQQQEQQLLILRRWPFQLTAPQPSATMMSLFVDYRVLAGRMRPVALRAQQCLVPGPVSLCFSKPQLKSIAICFIHCFYTSIFNRNLSPWDQKCIRK